MHNERGGGDCVTVILIPKRKMEGFDLFLALEANCYSFTQELWRVSGKPGGKGVPFQTVGKSSIEHVIPEFRRSSEAISGFHCPVGVGWAINFVENRVKKKSLFVYINRWARRENAPNAPILS